MKPKPKAKRPERPTRPEVSDELKDKLDSYKKEKEALGKDLKAAIDDIKKHFVYNPSDASEPEKPETPETPSSEKNG